MKPKLEKLIAVVTCCSIVCSIAYQVIVGFGLGVVESLMLAMFLGLLFLGLRMNLLGPEKND